MMSFKFLYHSFVIFILMINFANAADSLEIRNAWSPEAPPVAKVMAGYMKIKNTSSHDVKIIAAESTLFDHIEIHRMKMNNGMMRMIKQDSLPVKAHEMVELKPGELHMMLIGPKKVIKNGSLIPVTLRLSNNEKLTIKLMVI